MCVTSGVLRDVPMIVPLHFMVEHFGFRVRGGLDEVVVQQRKDIPTEVV